MSDIRDFARFIRGRWDWTRFGYERGFPRGCQFTDIDAYLEFDGHRLAIENKQWDGVGDFPGLPAKGQLLALQDEARLGKRVFVLYGCGVCNDPYTVYDVGYNEWHDWVGESKVQRRMKLKRLIDQAMGLDQPADETE
jgi:hypothetical protein